MRAVPELHVRVVSSGLMTVLAAAAAVLTSIPAFCLQRFWSCCGLHRPSRRGPGLGAGWLPAELLAGHRAWLLREGFLGVSDVFHLRQIARAVIDFGRLAHANGSSGVVARVVEGLCTGARSSSTFARSELHRDERPADDLPARVFATRRLASRSGCTYCL